MADVLRGPRYKIHYGGLPAFLQLADYPLKDIHDRLGAFAVEEGIQWIDLQPLFAGKNERDYWVHPCDFHPNPYAHCEAANFLYDAVDR
jgi:hypothetical protein